MSGEILAGFANAFHLEPILYMNLGVFLGIIFGCIPGLTGNLGILLLLPFTAGMELSNAIIFLAAIFCGGEFGGSISAILIGTPGTNSATCTMIEGYPMAKKGHARKALMMALTASTIGGVVSALALLTLAPTIAHFTIEFGPPEYFALAFFGLSIIASLSGNSLGKGLVAGCIGVMLSLVGIDIASGAHRFTFGNLNLLRGVALIPLLTGLFAIPNIVEKIKGRGSHDSDAEIVTMRKDDKLTAADVRGVGRVLTKSTIIGVIVGAIPGAGTAIAAFISYNEAKRTSKHPERFGHGAIEGVAAAESANNAVTSASLIPLLTFGIPGSPSAAALIGAFAMQGVALGPMLFREHGVVVYTIMFGLVLANIFMYFQGRVFAAYCAKLAHVPAEVLAPVLVVICAAGAYSVNNSSFDVKVFMIFGAFAYLLSLMKIPPVPIVLGFVLGSLMEFNLRRGLIMSRGDWSIFLTRPISLAIILLTLATMVYAIVTSNNAKKRAIIAQEDD